jgi:L-threonylcarbamoyladenylate synthase
LQRFHIDDALSLDQEKQVREAIASGELIIFPTDTVYGLGCDAFDSAAIKRISELKNRNFASPYSVHLGNISEIDQIAIFETQTQNDLISKILPGPYTVLMKASDHAPQDCVSDDGKIGIRIPESEPFRKFYNLANRPLVGTSVNYSGKEPILDPNVMINTFGKDIKILITTKFELSGESSSILDLTQDPPLVIRGSFPHAL